MWELIGIALGVVLFYVYSQSHNKPAMRARGGEECMYCPFRIKAGEKKVFGNKGWGHVECVERRW